MRWSTWRRRATSNRLFTLLLSLGVGLRVLAEVAYWPGLQFPDSGGYLANAAHLGPSLWHPDGYPLFLATLEWTHQVGLVALVQHVLGVLSGVLLFRVLRTFDVSSPWAAVAAAPVLLDPMQVDLEQYVLSDVLFFFVVVLLLFLTLTRPPSTRLAVAVGLLVAYATLVRTIALLVALPIAAFILAQRRGSLRRLMLATLAAAVPLLGYAAAFDVAHGAFALQAYSGRWLYGRVVGIAHCGKDHLPPPSRRLCAATPTYARVLPSEFVWNHRLPYTEAAGLPTDPVARSQLAGRFARDVIIHQPAGYARVIAADVLRAFSPSRETGYHGWFTGSWRFYQPGQPGFWRTTPMTTGFFHERVHGYVLRRPALWLHDYERFIFVPGPAFAFSVLAALAGASLAWRTRSGRAGAVLTVAVLLLLVVPIATVDLDARYVLSAEELCTAAAVLGVTAARQVLSPRLRLPAFSRIAKVAVTSVVLAGCVLSNTDASPAYGDLRLLRAAHLADPPRQQSLHGRLLVAISVPTIERLVCVRGVRYEDVRFEASIRWRSGPAALAAADDFMLGGVVSHRFLSPYLPVSRAAGLLHPVLVSRRYRATGGVVDFAVPPGRSGTLTYIDPYGAGAVAWHFVPRPGPANAVPLICRSSKNA